MSDETAHAEIHNSQARRSEGFRSDLEHAINCHSMENGSDTPDFLLAEYLADCLAAYDKAVTAREKWYGRAPQTIGEI